MAPMKYKKPSSKVRLVVSDMDGTLLTPEKTVSQASLGAIQHLKDRGIKVCLVSSRPPGGIEMYFPQLQLQTAYGALNGGTLFAPSGQTLSSLTLRKDVALKAVSILEKHRVQAWLFRRHDWIVPDAKNPLVEEESEELQMHPTTYGDFARDNYDLAKISGCSTDTHALQSAYQELQTTIGKKASVSPSHVTLLDVTPLQANKGYALTHLADYYAIDPSEVAAIGDMDNDIPMLSIAGVAIAMGQGRAHVKENAHFTTRANAHEGWAYAMENFVLPRA